ncbi:PepSY domain-containing protein [Streptomyces huiliensis]|uniref:PepSY domain-containing protein n=1 Tax=Streptomyces huiliensis TaxID=2876027 RepID=UPI001CBCEDCB|nr:PepSY domain-containing protein [Streptomyces huiliensis]MBZ4323160.1 PepSY domain-containing protein [Streptomyces huiliensis]
MAPSGLDQNRTDSSPFRPFRRPRPRAALLAACGAATAALLLTGCGDDGGDGGKTASPSAGTSPSGSGAPTVTGPSPATERPLTSDQAERKALVPAAKTDWEQAARAATGDVAGSKLLAVELKRAPDGGPEWHAEVATADGTAHSVVVDGVTGKVTKSAADADQDADDKRERADHLKAARVTPQDAATTATGRKKGTITTLELETSDEKTGGGKKLIWKVDVVTTNDWNKTTYDIDATDRAVLREHVDRD